MLLNRSNYLLESALEIAFPFKSSSHSLLQSVIIYSSICAPQIVHCFLTSVHLLICFCQTNFQSQVLIMTLQVIFILAYRSLVKMINSKSLKFILTNFSLLLTVFRNTEAVCTSWFPFSNTSTPISFLHRQTLPVQ